MILLLQLLLALVLVGPLALALRPPRALPTVRDASLALHRAQLAALTDDDTLPADQRAAAALEVQRRLLAAGALAAPRLNGDARGLILLLLFALPLMGFMLYLPGSAPNIPSVTYAQQQAQLDDIIAKLRAHLALAVPGSDDASQGEAYLGEALTEQARTLTPEARALFTDSLAHAPAGASWRGLDMQRLGGSAQPP
jgi:cytochrome c-type biogenesis protein CcmH